MRTFFRRGSLPAILCAIGLSVGTGLTGAYATDELATDEIVSLADIQQSIDGVSRVHPELILPTIDAEADGDQVKAASRTTGVEITIPTELTNSIELSSDHGSTLEIGLLNEIAAEPGFLVSDSSVLFTSGVGLGWAIRPTGAGVQVIATIANSSSGQDLSFRLNVPNDARLEERPDGIYIENSTTTFAALDKAWAVDALGNQLETSYSLVHGVLTQSIDFSEAQAFPVTADPAWSYVYTYDTFRSPAEVNSFLHTCFNCYFPVSGAPRSFPAVGDILPLWVVWPGDAPVTVVSSRYSTLGNPYLSFGFRANAGHFDGEGSNIIFTFTSNKKLTVKAWIENEATDDWIVRAGAWYSWANFAANLMLAPRS